MHVLIIPGYGMPELDEKVIRQAAEPFGPDAFIATQADDQFEGLAPNTYAERVLSWLTSDAPATVLVSHQTPPELVDCLAVQLTGRQSTLVTIDGDRIKQYHRPQKPAPGLPGGFNRPLPPAEAVYVL